jgi:hypothetical protein
MNPTLNFSGKVSSLRAWGACWTNVQDTWLLPGIEEGSSQELRLQLNREPTLTGEDQPEE